MQCEIFGYIKPPICKDENDLKRDPAAEAIYDQWFKKLEEGASYSEVADWLNDSGIKPGPYSRRQTWDCAMVARVTHNPILKGLRLRNRMITRKHHQSGHRISVKARPEDLKTRFCAHLIFIEPGRYDRVIQKLSLRNSRFKRHTVDGADPLQNRPKKRTIWPGQHAVCGICGRPMVYGGHGQKGHLVCRGNKEYVCWNGVSADGLKASESILRAMMVCIETLPGFDAQFRRQVQEHIENLTISRATKETQLNQMHHELVRKRNNLLAALEEYGPSPSLKDRLAELDRQETALVVQREQLISTRPADVKIPSISKIKEIVNDRFGALDRRTAEFGRLMQGLLSSVKLFSYVLCDGGHPVLRAHINLNLVALVPASNKNDGHGEKLQQPIIVDLFDVPQRESFRQQIMTLTAQGLRQRDIAAQLGITQPAVQRAVALDKTMHERGLDDPYILLAEPPASNGRMRAHKHARFRFQPLGSASGEAA